MANTKMPRHEKPKRKKEYELSTFSSSYIIPKSPYHALITTIGQHKFRNAKHHFRAAKAGWKFRGAT
jgi:hypothetical protein